VQGAYALWQRGDWSLTPFAHFEQFDAQAERPSGFPADPANGGRGMSVGPSFKLHPQGVFKADYHEPSTTASTFASTSVSGISSSLPRLALRPEP
jgi:hypothetical protein